MGEIRELPPDLISKIAAGEVITRPSDIIKELVENSIDAGATRINITIEDGGKERIIVEDNGSGIREEDLELAFKLHTSSKVNDTNLFSVKTLGFRGEALASISIVSKIKCRTRHLTESEGSEITMEAGKILKKRHVKAPYGTRIEVTGLFFNVPARRKFLKSSQVERRNIIALLSHMALIHHEIHVSLLEKKRGKITKIIESPSRKTILAAIFDVLGNEIASQLIPINGKAGRWDVEGFISIPSLVRKDRSYQFVSVNGRIVKVTELNKAIEAGYGPRLLKGNYPVFVINVKGESRWVDYNVHPQKVEVRFESGDPIFDELTILVNSSLEENVSLPTLTESKAEKVSVSSGKSDVEAFPLIEAARSDEISRAQESYSQQTLDTMLDTKTTFEHSSAHVERGFRVLGQIMRKFALVEKDDELWLMDLHACDERVKFEQFAKSKDRFIMSQSLLQPLRVGLQPIEIDLLDEISDVLKKFGLEISISGNSVLVHSLPVYFDQEISKDTIFNLLADVIAFYTEKSENVISSPFNQLEYKVVSRLACHGAYRAGTFVRNAKIIEILTNLLKCKDPWTCAHGRPTIIRIEQNTIEKWFKRIGQ